MDKRTQRNHIRAAREWLGRADDSLAQDNDVQGDLKLMLARAELAHVGPSARSCRLKIWGRRGLALLTAVLLAVIFWWQPAAAPPAPEMPAPTAPVAENVAAASQEPNLPLREIPMQAEQIAAEPKAEVPAQVPVTPLPEKNNAPAPSVEADAPVSPSPQIPNQEKQQLMQSAGKILRQ